MSIHVCTFFSPFAQSRHILSLSPDSSLASGDAPRQKSRVCMCDTKTSEIICGRKKLPSAAFFETAQAESIDRKKNSHSSHKPALKLGSAAGTPPLAESRVCMCVTKTSKIIRGRKKPLSAAFFETARVESIDRTQSSTPAQSSPETRFGV